MTGSTGPRFSRRTLLTAGAAAFLAGCSSSPRRTPAATPTDPTATPWPSATAVPTTPPPTAAAPVGLPPYEVLAGEVEPACKITAVRTLESALTWRNGEHDLPLIQRRISALGAETEAASPLSPVLGGVPWSSLQVVYPQYGGLTPDRSAASVMIVCEQVIPDGPDVHARSLTVDTRLESRNGIWVVTEMRLTDPPEPIAEMSAAAQAVVDHDNIVLPRTARKDIEAGLVDDQVLLLLTELAAQWRIDVHVFATGHPRMVFGTDRVSNHTVGRAVDVWALDEIPVIDHARSPWKAVMEAAAAVGADEIGGPQDVDGVRGRPPYFSDHVHQDHLHLGFEPPGGQQREAPTG